MAVLSSKKKAKPAAKKAAPKPSKPAPKHVQYEPSHFVWLADGHKRKPALVLWGEKDGVIVVYVTPTETKGDTGRREVPYSAIEGFIHG